MNLTANTVFITGGGSGIGRALAEAFHQRGNQVIISGRRKSALEATIRANPGMASIELDVQDNRSIQDAARQVTQDFPKLNVLINNAGIMLPDSADDVQDDAQLVATVMTNLVGPIRVTSALIEHLKAKPSATIIYNTSVLGFVPMAATSVYSATKAALHSYVLSQRFRLRNTAVSVIELAPPWVRTELMNSLEAEAAMPLDAFLQQAVQQLRTDALEILAGNAPQLRGNPGPQEHAFVNDFNASLPF
jgi:uncharacterized oxidoreductase